MTDWLRPMFNRSRTPGPSSSTISTERQSSLSTEDSNDFDESMSRLRPTSRVSSHIGLASSTPPIPQTPGLFTSMRAPLDVYHKPSPDQMAESLKVVMMNQSSTEPVPISMNSCILHVLEAYQDLRQQLNQKEETVEELKEELKQSHTRDIKEFENLATQWEEKEEDYKSEIKKLEVLLSKTKDGMEKVSLARSKSRVHGSRGAAESITWGIDTIKARHAARNSIYGDQPETDSSVYSMQPGIQVDRIIRSKQSNNDLHVASASMRNSIPELTKSHLEALEREQFEEQHGVSFDSSASATSMNQSFHRKASGLGAEKGLGIDIHEKPLPGIPQSPLLNMEAKIGSRSASESNEVYQTELEEEPRPGDLMSFSFNPGDDISILAQEAKYEVKKKKKKAAGNHTRPDRSPIASKIPEKPSESSSAADTSPRRRPETPAQKLLRKSTAIAKPAISRDTQESESLKRDDSISSVVTAVRDNSGQSSAAGSIQSSQNSRQRLNRSIGSSEAVTAAVRALAVVNVKGKMTSSGTYGEGSGGSSKGSGERRSGSASYEEPRESSKVTDEPVRNARQNGKTSSGASSTVGASIGRSETPPKKQEKRNGE